MHVKNRYRIFKRSSGIFFIQDNLTGKQESLKTRDKNVAKQLFVARNEAHRQPAMNIQIAQIYLRHSDARLATRTWQDVINQIIEAKSGDTRTRWEYIGKCKDFELIRNRKLIETTAEHFLKTLKDGTTSTNVYLRRLHNYAIGMHWIPWPVLPKRQWPAVVHRERRAITFDEHQKIINREGNLATRAFYQLLWHLGGSQGDIANLRAEDIDWNDRTIAYERQKTGVTSLISFGDEVAEILKTLPQVGQLFPALARIHSRHRAKLFIKRLQTVGVTGVSLHSYRYAWAERARAAGYPERFAMQALGHSSKAVHRAYARKAQVLLPPLEDYERRAKAGTVVPMRSEPAVNVG